MSIKRYYSACASGYVCRLARTNSVTDLEMLDNHYFLSKILCFAVLLLESPLGYVVQTQRKSWLRSASSVRTRRPFVYYFQCKVGALG